jgi:hypothetical protein
MKSSLNSEMPATATIPRRRVAFGLLAVAALLLVGVVLFLFDPLRHNFYPACVFHKLTGLNCPGCGGLRALHHLTHGDILTAFHCHPLFIALLPFILLAAIRWLLRGPQAFERNTVFFRPAILWTLLAVTLLFTILRNLPGPAFAWMSP